MNKIAGLTLLSALFVVGCASQSGQTAPTHRWASTEVVDEMQYRNDHARCQSQANIDGKSFDPTSPGFADYKQCMSNSGYVLTAYNQ